MNGTERITIKRYEGFSRVGASFPCSCHEHMVWTEDDGGGHIDCFSDVTATMDCLIRRSQIRWLRPEPRH